MKNKATRLLIIIIAALVVLAAGGIAISTFIQGSSGKLAFSKTMVKETIVNEVCDIEEFVKNPQGKTLRLTAVYTDESGIEKNYITAGLTFKPTQIGEVIVTVEANDGEKIETTIEVIEAAPTIATTKDAEFEWKETILLQELKDYIVYKSVSEPEFHVTSAEYMDQKFELADETEFTFAEVGIYIFSFELSNRGGLVTGQLQVEANVVLTSNEKHDLTNNSALFGDTHAQLTLSEEHSKNSDWAWQIKAHPSDTYNDPNGGYLKNQIIIDFGREIDVSQYYFVMDIKASKDSMGIAVHYVEDDITKQSSPMGYHDGLGEWNTISGRDRVTEGKYTRLIIVLIHQQQEGAYDPENVTCLIDNLSLHQYPDKNAPIIVDGVQDYDITTSKITWKSSGALGEYEMPFVKFNKAYTNETMTFTTKVDTSKQRQLILGARMEDGVIGYGNAKGLTVTFFDGFLEIYGPEYGTWLYAENIKLESNKEYTFAYSVETVDSQDTFYLKVTDASGDIVYNCALPLAKGSVNKTGSFVIWNPADKVTIEYSNPQTVKRKRTINQIVPENGKDGAIELSCAVEGSLPGASYLAMEGDYTTETFTFSTDIKNGKVPNIMIGARIKGITANPTTAEGVIAWFGWDEENARGFCEVHAPQYGKWAGSEILTLESNTKYTFHVSMIGNQFRLIVEKGAELILDKRFEIEDHVSTSGNFMVWNMDAERSIAYEMPKIVVEPENKNVIVNNVTEAGVAELETVVPNDRAASSYLALEGNYTSEIFSFTTTIAKGNTPNILLGARIKEVDANPTTAKGIIVEFGWDAANSRGFYEIHAPQHGSWLGADILTFEDGKHYTFHVSMKGNQFSLAIEQGGETTYSRVWEINTEVPERGNFMVWNMDAQRNISYEVPEIATKPENKNVIVNNVTEAGVAKLETIVTGYPDTASYLALEGNYTNEVFVFTTTVADQTMPNLWIGTHVEGTDPTTAQGVIVSFGWDATNNRGFYEIHAPNRQTWIAADILTLESGKTYTFHVSMNDNEFCMLVEQGGTTVHTKIVTISNAPASGNFMVWNMDAQRNISYEVPETPAISLTIAGLSAGVNNVVQEHESGNILYMFYVDTNHKAAASWVGNENSAKLYINGTTEVYGLATWDNMTGRLYVHALLSPEIEVNSITIKAGTRYTINNTVYEIETDFIVGIDNRVIYEIVPLKFTGLHEWSRVQDGTYMLYLQTNQQTTVGWQGWDHEVEILVDGSEGYLANAIWDNATGLMYMQPALSTGATVNYITIKAGTQLTINGKRYEITDDYTVYHNNGGLHENG